MPGMQAEALQFFAQLGHGGDSADARDELEILGEVIAIQQENHGCHHPRATKQATPKHGVGKLLGRQLVLLAEKVCKRSHNARVCRMSRTNYGRNTRLTPIFCGYPWR